MVRVEYHGNKAQIQGGMSCYSNYDIRPEERMYEKQRTVKKPSVFVVVGEQ